MAAYFSGTASCTCVIWARISRVPPRVQACRETRSQEGRVPGRLRLDRWSSPHDAHGTRMMHVHVRMRMGIGAPNRAAHPT